MKRAKNLVRNIIISVICIYFFNPPIVDSFAYKLNEENFYEDLDIIKEEKRADSFYIEIQGKIQQFQKEANKKNNVINSKEVIEQTSIKNEIHSEVRVSDNSNKSIVKPDNSNKSNSNNNEPVDKQATTTVLKSRKEILDGIIATLPNKVKEVYVSVKVKVELSNELNKNTLGTFDIANRTIYFKDSEEAITSAVVYHEFGHLIDFVYNNSVGANGSEEFIKIYEEEKDKFITDGNKGYCISSREEYLAQSFSEYLCNPDRLKANVPKTYEYIGWLINSINNSMIIETNSFFDSF